MGSIKSVIRIILIVAVLLFFQSCGIPQMFRWEKNSEYSISSSAIRFNISYTTDSGSKPLTPKEGFPRLHFFYAIAPKTGLTSNADSLLISSFNSRYSDSVPPTTTDISRHDPIVTRTVYPTDASSSTTTSSVIGLYEFVEYNEDDGTFSRPSFPDDISYFLYDTESTYDRVIRYSADIVQYDNGYAIELTLNAGTSEEIVYTLVRNNGEPFMADITEYIEEQGSSEVREFDYGDAASDFQMPSIYIFVSCSFACVNYTSVYTIPLTTVGSIELTAL